MPKTLLAVSHLRQRAESDCLPTCVQLVLAYLGRAESYEQLTRLLGTRWFGTPLENILRLDQLGLKVTLKESSLEEISRHLQNNRPVIAFVNTVNLPYWRTDTDHVVVVIGMDDEFIYVNDPYFAEAPQRIPSSLFELSMMQFDFRCAIIEEPTTV
jgi:ABC-type bacteriocin/lantibiotic exporter with double-glycine peptidase domain